MDRFKDLFSGHASDYSTYRPHYPRELFEFLSKNCSVRSAVWDVGTGNGQAAFALVDFFSEVFATDPSAPQIAKASTHPKIHYSVAKAEDSKLPIHSVDLITVAQAFHWFDQKEFFLEVRRVAKPDAILAVWCYELTTISPEIDRVVFHLYKEILGEYWDGARKLVEEGYRNVSFPFTEMESAKIPMQANWTLDEMMGYLGTWSALQKYKTKNERDPRQDISKDLERAWGVEEKRLVQWPLSLRIFRVN